MLKYKIIEGKTKPSKSLEAMQLESLTGGEHVKK